MRVNKQRMRRYWKERGLDDAVPFHEFYKDLREYLTEGEAIPVNVRIDVDGADFRLPSYIRAELPPSDKAVNVRYCRKSDETIFEMLAGMSDGGLRDLARRLLGPAFEGEAVLHFRLGDSGTPFARIPLNKKEG